MKSLNEMQIEEVRNTDGGIIQGASHTCHVLNHKIRNNIIIKAVCDLRKISKDFDSIACCGVSGLMVVPQIAEILNKNILVVRKDERRYSDFTTEGVAPFRYVVIDDLICSGKTIKHITDTIKEEYPRARALGVYCYLPEECGYPDDHEGSKLCERDLGLPLLNL
jgi:adenine/guanine phosphoribosyltransferase-like PRPP-binding protein